MTAEVAAEACANVVEAKKRADCEFDVRVTGHRGFGKSYEIMQSFRPLPPGWYSPEPSNPPACEKCKPYRDCKACDPCPLPSPWWRWSAIALGIALLLLFLIIGLRSGKKR